MTVPVGGSVDAAALPAAFDLGPAATARFDSRLPGGTQGGARASEGKTAVEATGRGVAIDTDLPVALGVAVAVVVERATLGAVEVAAVVEVALEVNAGERLGVAVGEKVAVPKPAWTGGVAGRRVAVAGGVGATAGAAT